MTKLEGLDEEMEEFEVEAVRLEGAEGDVEETGSDNRSRCATSLSWVATNPHFRQT